MTDNKPSELRAEYLISHHLIKYKFNITKPAFDIEGADLLILDNIHEKTTKFLKVQSKLKTITSRKNTEVKIPVRYVTENFVLFLYLNREEEDEVLYTFFKEDIERWRIRKDEYILSLSEKAVLEFSENIFNKKSVRTLNELLKAQEVKNYTSIIIDGIFLEKAIVSTRKLYTDLWPGKIFEHLTLENIVNNLLSYNRFNSAIENINCLVFLSAHHSLDSIVALPPNKDYQNFTSKHRFSIYKSEEIISFQVLEQLKRLINAENILLVADDISYQKELDELAQKGVNIILIKESTDSGSRLFTPFRWGDIAYPLGRSLGLQEYEL